MLVFSSAERTNSLALSLRPFQMRWYKSKIRPAFDSKCGSRGKIQQQCCQGRMASSFSHRQMVVSLRDAVRPQARTWEPSSATLQREKGTDATGKFAGDGFNLHDQFWGKKLGGGRAVGSLPDRPAVFRRIVFASG